jgi:hypothetical protein
MDTEKPSESAALLICIHILKLNPNPVTFSQIKEATGLAKSTLHYNLTKLVKDGLLEEVNGGYKIKNKEEFLSTVLKHYTVFFGRILPQYIIFTWIFMGTLVFLILSEIFVPQIKFIGFIILAIGIWQSLRMVYRYKL